MITGAALDPIVVNAQLTLDDWRALQAAASTRLARSETARGQWLRTAGLVAVFAVAAFLGLRFLDTLVAAVDWTSLVAGAGIVVAAILVNSRIALRRIAPSPNGTFLGSCTYELGADGLRATRRGAHSFSSWSSVLDVTRSDAHVFVWIDQLTAYVIPGRALPEGVTIEGVVEWIGAERARAPAAEPSAEPSPGAAAPAASAAAPPQRRRGARLLDLLSLIALRRRAVLTEPNQGIVAALTTLLALGTWAAFDRWQSGPEPVLYIYGLPPVAWYLLGGLAVAWVLARASVPRIALARAIVVSALGAWVAIVYTYLGGSLPGSVWGSVCLAALAVVYALSYLSRATHALTGQAQPGAVLAALGASAAFLWASEALYVYPMMWTPGDVEESVDGAGYDEIEPLLFAQRERVDAALAAVPPNDPSAAELYFIGFAGHGEQKVFAEEIKFAERAVKHRYANRVGSVLLLNDSRDVDGAPLATASTLRYALRGVAEKMDVDDDVLFLALSSHGSSEWTLSVTNGPLPLTNLSAAQLAAALDEAGIKWRVIVISACYAGGFIEALQNPHTIVLAAAAPDRTSFGCSDERDLTYFGEAFYRDAFPTAATLRDAFAAAERLVLEREAAELVQTPSQPTAFFGAELEHKLAAIE